MAELWEVIHEIKNGKAIEVQNYLGEKSYFFLRNGTIWFAKPSEQYEVRECLCDLHANAKVVTTPSCLREKLTFTQAIAALKDGKSVMSCIGTCFFFDTNKKMVCYESSGAVAEFRGDEVAGTWIAFD